MAESVEAVTSTGTLKVSLQELKNLATRLRNLSTDITNQYRKNVVKVLESSSDCFVVAGIHSDSIMNSFNSIYTSLNDQINTLCDLLENQIIPNYDNLNGAIINMFNQDFTNQLEDLLPGLVFIK